MLILLASASLAVIFSKIHLLRKPSVDSPQAVCTLARRPGAAAVPSLIACAFVASVCPRLDSELLRRLMGLAF